MRVKRGVHARKRHRTLMQRAKGYRGAASRRIRVANEAVMHAGQYAYRDRRARKSDLRGLWIVRINAAARESGLSYSRFMRGLRTAGIEIDRRMLAEMAVSDPRTFAKLVEEARTSLDSESA
jgi:large subunit ribosomal protein L20